jgi:uncharacterized protein
VQLPKPDFTPRLEMLDALRGFALMGLFSVHVIELYELYWAHAEKSIIHDVVFGTFAGKAFALLALCFGVSFYIIMDRAGKRGVDFSGRFIWRLTLLGIMGYLHGLIYRGDVLQTLAVMGIVLIPFNRIKNNRLLVAIAIACFLQIPLLTQAWFAAQGAAWANQPPNYYNDPAMKIYTDGTFLEVIKANLGVGQAAKWWFYIETGRVMQLIGLFLIGLVLGRSGFFTTPERFKTPRLFGLIIAIACAIGLNWAKPLVVGLVPKLAGPDMARACTGTVIQSLCDLSLMFVLMLGFIALYTRFAHRLLNLLAPVGRMTLTFYVSQSLVFVPLYYHFGLGWHAWISQSQALGLGVVFFTAQVIFAHVWFRHFLYGPLEWLWRAATYLTLKVPFVKRTTTMAPQG